MISANNPGPTGDEYLLFEIGVCLVLRKRAKVCRTCAMLKPVSKQTIVFLDH